MGDLSDRYDGLAAGLVRGKGAYGRKPAKSVLARISGEVGPIQVHHSNGENGMTIQTIQNVAPILEANKRERQSGHDGYTPSRDLKKVASIPLIEVHRLLQKGIDIFNPDDWEKVTSMLDSPDWQAFRTSSGRISKRPTREFFKASTGN